MGGRQSAGRLDQHGQDLAPRTGSLGKPRTQRHALDQFHRDPDAILHRAGIEDGHDVGVRDAGQRSRFTQQAGLAARVALQRRCHHLERDRAIELGVVRGVDHPHGSLPRGTAKLVAAQRGHVLPFAEQPRRQLRPQTRPFERVLFGASRREAVG